MTHFAIFIVVVKQKFKKNKEVDFCRMVYKQKNELKKKIFNSSL